MAEPLSLRALRAFDAAARHGSYSRAAEELGLTHGAISHSIRELELRTGHMLFARSGRRMVPTSEAIGLVTQVRQALDILDRAMPAAQTEPRTGLAISVHPGLSTRWFMARLRSFQAAHPEVVIEVKLRHDPIDFLGADIDVAVRYGPGDWPNTVAEPLWSEELFPVCAPAYRDALGLEGPQDLERACLLGHQWQAWAPWLRAAGLPTTEPKSPFVFADTSMALRAAECGTGVALTRSLLARDGLASGTLIRLFDISVPDIYGYYIVRRRGDAAHPLLAPLRDHLRERDTPGETPIRS